MATNMQDGVYNAIPVAAGVYEKNGLKLEVRFNLCDDNGTAYTQTGTDGNEYPIEKRMYYALVSKDGAVNTKVIEYLQAWAAGWDGIDPFWFAEPGNLAAIGMVEVTLKTEPAWNDPAKTYQNIKFVNPVGHAAAHGGNTSEVASGDKAAIMAKYGAKFKAALGATVKPLAAKPAPAPRAAAPAAKPAPAPVRAPVKPAPAPAVSAPADVPDGIAGQGVAWEYFLEHLPEGVKEADRDAKWFELVDAVSEGKDQREMTGTQWKAVMGAVDTMDMPF